MAQTELEIVKDWFNLTRVGESNWDNLRVPLLEWGYNVNRNFEQVYKDAFGLGYDLNNDGAPNLATDLQTQINNLLSGSSELLGTTSDTFEINTDGFGARFDTTGLTVTRVVTFPDAAAQQMVGRTATQTLSNKTLDETNVVPKFFYGSEHIDANDYTQIIWKNQRASPTITLVLFGEEFHRAHYTEMPSHTHSGTTLSSLTTHDHTFSGTTSGQSATHTHTGTYGGTTPIINLEDEDGNGNFGRTQVFGGGEYGMSKDGSVLAGGKFVVPAQVTSVSGTSDANSVDHTHTYSGTTATTDLAHTHTFTSDATGTTTTEALTAAEKTFLNGMTVFVDGVDQTAAILALADANYVGLFAAFGDGTGAHRLNNLALADPGPGTGEMDISSLATTAAFHRIEFRQGAAAGGKINWLLEVA
ncbi:MAG: hypothetical protein UY96_C0032G0002 [Parcubacteria group bacterium GW2011_GWB1_56_8]|nr:MAG: hypothetical protein UY96_C0032G0002 [Parcubacteria group bacterium GW2011_GWB1_56_8]